MGCDDDEPRITTYGDKFHSFLEAMNNFLSFFYCLWVFILIWEMKKILLHEKYYFVFFYFYIYLNRQKILKARIEKKWKRILITKEMNKKIVGDNFKSFFFLIFFVFLATAAINFYEQAFSSKVSLYTFKCLSREFEWLLVFDEQTNEYFSFLFVVVFVVVVETSSTADDDDVWIIN